MTRIALAFVVLLLVGPAQAQLRGHGGPVRALAISSGERLPGVTFRRYRKPTFTKPAPPDLRQEIAVHCDAVVEALAD